MGPSNPTLRKIARSMRQESLWVAQRFQRCDSGAQAGRLQPLRDLVHQEFWPGRTVGIFRECSRQPLLDWILADILFEVVIVLSSAHTPVVEALFPDFAGKC